MQIRALPSAAGAGALRCLALLGCQSERLTDPDLAKGGASAPLKVDPTALTFRVPGSAPATVTASVQFVGLITAQAEPHRHHIGSDSVAEAAWVPARVLDVVCCR
ncbi:MAG TPA: hypothetical protein VEB59_17470, partial [Gemmatimonadales bacterium]|nr:hypothetical protein [Gemmatimonadales bacterium]